MREKFLGLLVASVMLSVAVGEDKRVSSTVGPVPPKDATLKVFLPSLELKAVTFNAALEALEAAGRKTDPNLNLNLVNQVDGQAADSLPRITMKLRNIPLGEALRYVCEAAGLRYRVDANAVVIYSPSQEQEQHMITRVYRVLPSIFEADLARSAREAAERRGTKTGLSSSATSGQVKLIGQ